MDERVTAHRCHEPTQKQTHLFVSLVDVMHGIEKLACLASCIKVDAIHKVVPTSVHAMQLLDDACLSLEPVVSITNIEYSTRKELKMRV